MIDVDAQDLAEQHVDVLRVVRRVVARAAVADADVEIAVGAEREHAAVVVGIGRDAGSSGARLSVESATFGFAETLVLGDDERAVAGARVVDEEAAVRRVLRVEGEAEQPSLAAGEDLRADVEEHRRRRTRRAEGRG